MNPWALNEMQAKLNYFEKEHAKLQKEAEILRKAIIILQEKEVNRAREIDGHER